MKKLRKRKFWNERNNNEQRKSKGGRYNEEQSTQERGNCYIVSKFYFLLGSCDGYILHLYTGITGSNLG